MPPNTKQYAIKSDWFIHAKWEPFLLLRIKRASRYWDSLWLDIGQEVKELSMIDDATDEDTRYLDDELWRRDGMTGTITAAFIDPSKVNSHKHRRRDTSRSSAKIIMYIY